MELIQYENKYFPSLLERMKKAVVQEFRKSPELIKILEYHFSWDQASPINGAGKKFRPLLLLLTMEAFGAKWQKGIEAASAIEFLHNYSLIHDDIEDRDEIRHGRQTVWKRYGIPQAINTGDALYGLAFAELDGLRSKVDPLNFQEIIRALSRAATRLTIGQTADLRFENETKVKLDDYWEMVNNKTSALFEAAVYIGALLGNANPVMLNAFTQFGGSFGRAFQAQDDLLGIWGVEKKTGKPSGGDLIKRKKTLPICFALQNDPQFRKLYNEDDFGFDHTQEAVELLMEDGAYQYSIDQVNLHTKQAIDQLERSNLKNDALTNLVNWSRELNGRIK